MTRAGLWVRSELRRRWRSLVLLTALAALVVTVVLTAVAGGRRTSTAFDRSLDERNAGHLDLHMQFHMDGRRNADLGNGKTADDVIAAVSRLPQVEGIDVGAALLLSPPEADFITAVSFDR